MTANIDEWVETFKDAALTDPRTSIKAGLLAVLDKHVKPMLEDAFVAGFLVSGEGYNGEYPHEFTDGETLRKELLAPSSEYILRIIQDLKG